MALSTAKSVGALPGAPDAERTRELGRSGARDGRHLGDVGAPEDRAAIRVASVPDRRALPGGQPRGAHGSDELAGLRRDRNGDLSRPRELEPDHETAAALLADADDSRPGRDVAERVVEAEAALGGRALALIVHGVD